MSNAVSQIQPKAEIHVKSDGLYLSVGSIIANWMGGYFPNEWMHRYSESVGNNGILTFPQIVDFFDAHSSHESNHNSGIYSALFLSKYMTDENEVFVSAKTTIDRLRVSLGDTAIGNEDSLYYSASLFRDAYVNHLRSKSIAKYGELHGDYDKLAETKQLKNIATNVVKKIIMREISGANTRIEHDETIIEIENKAKAEAAGVQA
jgi:hypothetical protein